MDQEKWMAKFTKMGIFWMHDGHKLRPHALLTSGNHSDGYLNASGIISDPKLLSQVCREILKELSWHVPVGSQVFGSAYGAINIAYEFARQLHLKCGFTEKVVKKVQFDYGSEEDMDLLYAGLRALEPVCRQIIVNMGMDKDKVKEQLSLLLQSFNLSEQDIEDFVDTFLNIKRTRMLVKRFEFEPGTKVLVVEDVLNTMGTTRKTIAALEEKGVTVLPYILAILNRSGQTHLDERRIFALIDQKMNIWHPDECPLCETGSDALRPKQNWIDLTADYD